MLLARKHCSGPKRNLEDRTGKRLPHNVHLWNHMLSNTKCVLRGINPGKAMKIILKWQTQSKKMLMKIILGAVWSPLYWHHKKFELLLGHPIIPTVPPGLVALPQDKAYRWPPTRPLLAVSIVSALSQACQGLQHMPPNPWRLLHGKQRLANGGMILYMY